MDRRSEWRGGVYIGSSVHSGSGKADNNIRVSQGTQAGGFQSATDALGGGIHRWEASAGSAAVHFEREWREEEESCLTGYLQVSGLAHM